MSSTEQSRLSISVDRIYPIYIEITNTIDTARIASFIDLHLEIYRRAS